MKLAFCGLGQMGAPMAARLLGHGDEVVVWNRTLARAAPLVGRGARLAATPAEAAAGADAVLTMLATPEAVEEVALGLGGGPAPLIEMSTIGPTAVRRIAERRPVVDAPVLGSVPQATEGSLRVFVGETAEQFARWRPVLERFGTPRHVGALGAGASMKLVANLCLGVLMTGLGEALAFARALDLPPADVLDVLGESPIQVTVRSKRALIEADEWPPNFKLTLAVKDMRLVVEEAERRGFAPRLAAAASVWMDEAEAAGYGDLDYSAVIRHILACSP